MELNVRDSLPNILFQLQVIADCNNENLFFIVYKCYLKTAFHPISVYHFYWSKVFKCVFLCVVKAKF